MKTRALADRVHGDAVVPADDLAGGVLDRAGAHPLAIPLLEQRSVAAFGDKADFLALRFQRSYQAALTGVRPDLDLGQLPDREAHPRELVLAELVEHVGLVLLLVRRLVKFKTVGATCNTAIVAGGHHVRAQGQRLAQEEAELDRLVAANARVGRASLEVGLRER